MKPEQAGTVEFAIATQYQHFRGHVIEKGYSKYTLASFQAQLKEFWEDNIEMLVKTPDADAKPKA